ncbi:DUF3298 and DUF4163 domain-containing protein [Bacillus sp. EAC]|uniref:DUF3298 and DUF4163 domain-containing protein n=1 Tax=Bacillus sp. EAC TaxID=1978338 RepID=UPI0015C50F4A|nr:DUF3298 and DUF4163 domain-containing protein [Bacillus sp. EAC]
MKYFFRMIVVIIFSSLTIMPSSTKAEVKQLAPIEKAQIYKVKLKNSPITYPQVKGLKNRIAQEKINATLRKGADLANKNRLKLLFEEKEAKKKWTSSQGPWRPYEYIFTYKVPFNDRNKLSVIYNEYSYTGGAHGMTVGTTYNFNINTGEIIPLSKLINNKAKVIQQYAYQQLQKKYSGYILIESPNEIALNDKNRLWVFDQKGIKLIFGEYEVAAYAAGMPEVVVPYHMYKK